MMRNGKSIEISVAYILGRITHELETFAESMGISVEELATRVGTLLLEGRKGNLNNMPKLRRKTTGKRKAVAEVEVDGSTHRKAPAKPGEAIRAYWAAMTPEQRRAEGIRRMKVAEAKRKQA